MTKSHIILSVSGVLVASLVAFAQQTPTTPAAAGTGQSGQAAAPPPQTGGRGGAPLLVPNPHYAFIHMTADVNASVDKVWARVGKFCDIGEWGGFGACTIVSGTDGELGVVRSIGSEIMVGKTQ